jgi:hypothetical protein
MTTRSLLLVLLLLSACGRIETPTPVPPPTATPVTTDTFETGGHIFGFTSPDLMRAAGMTWVKFQVVYNRGDAPGSVQPLLDKARAQNFKALLSIKGIPAQVSQRGYNTDFAAFLGGVAALKPDAIEVWNEENIDREWPSGSINGAAYTGLLKAAYPAIKAANAATLVISGAPAPTGFFGGACAAGGCDDDIFLRQMAAAGADDFMDCVGIHYNEGILPPDARSGDPRGNSSHYSRYYPAMVDLYTQVFPSKPLCFTELGYLSAEGFGPLPAGFEWAANTTVQNQADWLGAAAKLARQSKRVRLFIVWNVDAIDFSTDPQAGYAIVRSGGTCPACSKLAAAMQG